MEEESKQQYMYYYPCECDSNLTKFEIVCNNENLCIASRLEPKFVSQIILIFKALYDINFWFFNNDSLDVTEEESEQIGSDPEKWFELANANDSTITVQKNTSVKFFKNIRVSEDCGRFTWPFTVFDLNTYFD